MNEPDQNAMDIAWLKRAQAGETEPIGWLYDQHSGAIYRYLWAKTGNGQLAEDMTGEVFTRMVASLPDFQLTGVPFRAWLFRIAHNLVVDYYRKEGRVTAVPLDEVTMISNTEESPVAIVETQLTAENIQTALRQIDPVQQEVVVMRFLVGLSLQEVADSLDKSVAAVKSLQHRGLKALRVALHSSVAASAWESK